jgi:hypothetical protein
VDQEGNLKGLKLAMLGAIFGATLITGCAKKPDDAALVTNIQSQMFSDSLLKNSDLHINSSKGVVSLSGTVPNDAARLEAYKVASRTPGVVKVDDQMTVQSAQASAPAAPETPTLARSHRTPSPARNRRDKKWRASHQEVADSKSAANEPAAEPTPPPAASPAPPVQQVAQVTPPPPAPPQPRQVEVLAGTTVTIRMIDGVDSAVNHAGELFHATLEAPLVVDDQVVVSRGADVYVRLVSAKSAGRMSGKSELHLELVKLEFQGRSYPMVSSTYSAAGKSRGKNTAKKVGGGAVIGAVIGGLAGGGAGAAIGAGVGAGTGAVWNGVTRGQQIKIPSETKLDFELEQPITVTVMPRSSSSSSSSSAAAK